MDGVQQCPLALDEVTAAQLLHLSAVVKHSTAVAAAGMKRQSAPAT
jgi:hypothetical protein